MKQPVDAKQAGGPIDLALDLGPWRTLRPQRKCNVVGDSQVRIEAIALKHHGDATRARRDVIDDFVVDQDVAGRLPLQTGDDPQEGSLAATGWTEQHKKLAVADRQADTIKGSDVTEILSDIIGSNRSHSGLPLCLEQGTPKAALRGRQAAVALPDRYRHSTGRAARSTRPAARSGSCRRPLLVDQLDFLLGPGCRFLWRRFVGRSLGHHVDEDEIVRDLI